LVFAIPWAGYTWVGTTDTDYAGPPESATATAADVMYLIDSLAPHLPAIRDARRYWACAGVRALVDSTRSPSGVTRMHRIARHPGGLISIVGGKITGYRAIAEQVTDIVCEQLGRPRTAATTASPLPGAADTFDANGVLEQTYGARASLVHALVDSDATLGAPLVPLQPQIAAEVVFSTRQEWCVHLDDFMLRRSYLGFAPDRGLRAAEAVARWMQRELRWSDDERRRQLHTYQTRARRDLLEWTEQDATTAVSTHAR
jgi:glycerol-3-phosphate dehydrogenase